MRFWIVGGGTGGHVYPALAIIQALQAAAPDAALTWVGSTGGMEAPLVAHAGLPFIGIPAGGLHGVGPVKAVRSGLQLARGTLAAMHHIRRERPDAMLTTGGYISGPVAVAAALQRVPILVYLPDIEPAQSVKAVGRLAARIGTTVEDSRAFFQRKGEPSVRVVVTGYPLGDRITRWNREKGRAALHLDPDARVLLVFGGSRGARSINRALMANLAALVDLADVIHVSGELNWAEVSAARDALPESTKAHYHACPYLHDEMGAAMAAADLVVCRAGASTLGEFPYFGLPSILVPYPYAWRYQKVNAEWLAQRGAALVVEDGDLADRIFPVVRELLTDTQRREAMAAAASALAQPRAAQHLAELLLGLGRDSQ